MYRVAEPKPVIHLMAEDLDVHHEALRGWIRQAEADAGEWDDLPTTEEKDELTQLSGQGSSRHPRGWRDPAGCLTDHFGMTFGAPQADDAAGELRQFQVQVGSYLVADPQAFELMEPGEGPLDDPPGRDQAGSVGGVLACDLRCDAASAEEPTVLVVVVAP